MNHDALLSVQDRFPVDSRGRIAGPEPWSGQNGGHGWNGSKRGFFEHKRQLARIQRFLTKANTQSA